MEDMFKDMNGNKPRLLGAQRSQAERSKYALEDDSDDSDAEKDRKRGDRDDEDQIDNDVEELGDIVGRLRGAAIGMGTNLDTQNQRLDRLKEKVSPLTTTLEHLVTSADTRSQTDVVDDRVSRPWQADISGSSYLGLSHSTPCTEALWLLNTAATLCTLLPRYCVIDLSLTFKRTGPDEPREVESHPLSTANTSHQCNVARTSQNLHLGPGCVVQSGTDGPRNAFGVYVYLIVKMLITVLRCIRMCIGKCMHGRPDDEPRSSNENVSQLALLSNPRRELISRASCLTAIL